VQGATDAARAAADIVLTQPGLSTIVDGIIIARCIFVRIRNFITYRVAATLQLLIFFFIAVLSLRPKDFEPENPPADYPDNDHEWPNFFKMPVLMLMLITVLNDGTLISIGYDHAIPSKIPERWNLRVLFFIGSVLAIVAMCSSILLLYLCLDSWSDNSALRALGVDGLSYGQVTTAIYLKVSVSDFLTLFSARTGENWFWESAPSKALFGAASVALTLSTIIACSWPSSSPDEIYSLGLSRRKPYELPVYIWIYCLVWWIIQV
jgi:H+-transporting ATPase